MPTCITTLLSKRTSMSSFAHSDKVCSKSARSRRPCTCRVRRCRRRFAELSNSATRHERFQRALQAAMLQQQKAMQTLMEIDGTLYKVDVELTNYIQVISDEHIDGMKKTIELLKDDSVTD